MTEVRADIVASSNFADVETLLDAFHRGAATANLRLYFGCFHPEGRFLGTDATENWHVNDFYEFSKPYFLRGKGWTYTPRPETRKVTMFTDPVSPSSQFCIFDELLDSEDFHATSRGSGTCLYDSVQNRWLIAQYHLTFPIPNDLAKDMTQKIFLFESSQKDKSETESTAEFLAEWDRIQAQEAKNSKNSGNSSKKNKKK